MIGFHEHTFMNTFTTAACKAAGFTPSISIVSHMTENQLDLIAHGLGIGLLMKRHVLALSGHDVKVIDIEPAVTCRIDFCYKKGRKLSASAQNLIKFVKAYAAETA